MLTANAARAKLVETRKNKIQSHINAAIDDGKSLVYIRMHPTQEEINWVESYGYEAKDDDSGNLWVYWHREEKG